MAHAAGQTLSMSHPQDWRLQAVRPLTGLWRGPHSFQVGLDEHAVILEPVPAATHGLLALLSEPHSVAELAELSPELSSAWLDRLLQLLTEAGLIRQWHAAPARTVVVWGTGALAERIHVALQRAELQPLPLGQRVWPESNPPLIVLATGTIEPDRWLTDRLAATGHSSLVIRAEPGRGLVGPFVHPHQSPCLHCLDLLRAERDPQWPLLLAQLCRTRVAPATRLLEWLAGETVAEVARWHAHQPPELIGGTLELRLPELRRTQTRWPPHPDCRCQDRSHSQRLGTLAG